MMVLICVPLPKRAIQLSPFILTLATYLAPHQHQKGSGFTEGSLWWWLYALGTSIWRFFGVLTIARGVWAPFFLAV